MDVSFIVLFVLLSATSCSAKKGVQSGIKVAARSQSVVLQPWLVGLTAVVGFLFIVFIITIARRLFRGNRDPGDEWDYNNAEYLKEDDTKQTSL